MLKRVDDLFLKHSKIQSHVKASEREHKYMFNWFHSNAPLAEGYDDFILEPKDFVKVSSGRSTHLEDAIEDRLDFWPINVSLPSTLIAYAWKLT